MSEQVDTIRRVVKDLRRHAAASWPTDPATARAALRLAWLLTEAIGREEQHLVADPKAGPANAGDEAWFAWQTALILADRLRHQEATRV